MGGGTTVKLALVVEMAAVKLTTVAEVSYLELGVSLSPPRVSLGVPGASGASRKPGGRSRGGSNSGQGTLCPAPPKPGIGPDANENL